jgi:hypothetical protein
MIPMIAPSDNAGSEPLCAVTMVVFESPEADVVMVVIPEVDVVMDVIPEVDVVMYVIPERDVVDAIPREDVDVGGSPSERIRGKWIPISWAMLLIDRPSKIIEQSSFTVDCERNRHCKGKTGEDTPSSDGESKVPD